MERRPVSPLARIAGEVFLVVAPGGGSECPEKAFSSAEAEYAAGESKAVVIRLRSLRQSNPQFTDARLLLGQILPDLGQYNRRPADFPPQHSRSPEASADVLASQADAQFITGNVEEAKTAIRHSVEAGPENLAAAILTASITASVGNQEAASSVIDTLLSRQPKSAEALSATPTKSPDV
ncbi:hypothetical protein [Candidatus Accumulibacter sp. ACC003]|uniref:hypothetical protein n=1 Tax=Candidatus Accumulibacter sp. ACC003 TaxID=2823334 RepID=UPI0025C6DB89|nr:hypothetical protein [Candidatus Accumulibacter sp. ACC003]